LESQGVVFQGGREENNKKNGWIKRIGPGRQTKRQYHNRRLHYRLGGWEKGQRGFPPGALSAKRGENLPKESLEKPERKGIRKE